MAPADKNEWLDAVQTELLNFLAALERVQQSILFQDVNAAQRELDQASGDSLERAAQTLEQAAPSPLSGVLAQALVHLRRAHAVFVRERSWPEFGLAFLSSRGEQCQALELLYRERRQLTLIDNWLRLADNRADPRLDTADSPGSGLSHHSRNDQHHDYSLYVPEYYSDDHNWPLILALHGGYGRGDEYIWSWLRAARSRGYLVLAPKSIGPTWSIMQPGLDRDSIQAMLKEVGSRYALDTARVYLSGLSDGGTFSYLFGLECHEQFAALAPIAGVLSPMTDPLLRAGQGRELPIHVVHGAHDAVFAVQTARSTSQLLQSLNYQLTYTELPEWGHALTTHINETIVLPWFEQIESG